VRIACASQAPTSADERGHFTEEEDDPHYKALDRRLNYRKWCATRWGDLKEHISDETTREEFVEQAYVVAAAPRQDV
jgi:hypothetical protein